MPAFVPLSPFLGCHPHQTRSIPLCSPRRPSLTQFTAMARPPSERPKSVRGMQLLGTVLGTFAFVMLPGAQVHARAKTQTPAPTKDLRYDGRQELAGGEKAMSMTLTGGMFAMLGVWAWKQNRRDDELENIRIREEVERLEKLKAEFVDVEEEDDSLDDEDLLASLRERIGEGEADGEGKSEEGEQKSDVLLEEGVKSEGDTVDGSVDMLKRMWEATDDEQKSDRGKP